VIHPGWPRSQRAAGSESPSTWIGRPVMAGSLRLRKECDHSGCHRQVAAGLAARKERQSNLAFWEWKAPQVSLKASPVRAGGRETDFKPVCTGRHAPAVVRAR
jgi:hypothetical protein